MFDTRRPNARDFRADPCRGSESQVEITL